MNAGLHYFNALAACCLTVLWAYNADAGRAYLASLNALAVVFYIYAAEHCRRAAERDRQ